MSKILESKTFHILIIVLGAAFILLGAFHSEVWFDEAYTMALIRHDYSEIIRIDINDVHPVLYYLLLKLFTGVFGESIIACRIFSVLAGIIMAILGFTHIRKDFGAKTRISIFIFDIIFAIYGNVRNRNTYVYLDNAICHTNSNICL